MFLQMMRSSMERLEGGRGGEDSFTFLPAAADELGGDGSSVTKQSLPLLGRRS